MVLTERGMVEGGRLVLDEPVGLPDGTRVLVSIEPVAPTIEPERSGPVDFASLPSFGMWAGREDMQDAKAWMVRQWERRSDTRDVGPA